MDYQVIFKDTFRADLEHIVHWVAKHNSYAAHQLGERIIRMGESLSFFPSVTSAFASVPASGGSSSGGISSILSDSNRITHRGDSAVLGRPPRNEPITLTQLSRLSPAFFIHAVLDWRRNPAWIRSQLKNR